MQLIDTWKLVVLERYAKFDGRANRSEFWWYYLANIVIAIALFVLIGIAGAIADVLGVLVWFAYFGFVLAMIVPTIAAGIRRLHDTDKSGWLLLIALVPLVGPIILLVFLAMEGTQGPNQYGAGPEPDATGATAATA